MMAVTGNTSSRPTKTAKDELVRHDSGQSSSRDTPFSSTEGEYDDEEEEEEEEDDDVEEEEEDEEEESAVENVRFDERFLAQLLAFDSSLASQSNSNNSLPRSNVNKPQLDTGNQGAFSTISLPLNTISSTNDASARHTPSNTSNLPFSAPTPSNEFYDGAINFLTEVLGSSTPSFWNGDASLAQSAGDLKWASQSNTPAASLGPTDFSAPDLQAAKTEFKNLQPLISNLIARLKGFPIQDGQQIGQTLEDDLVILLQSLMAHRQAQQNRQAQEQLDQSMNMLRNAPQSNNNNIISGQGDPTTIIGPATFQQANTASTQLYPSQPGFSIVDFDFGDDDDDPDFIPNNVNLDFANSTDFADALAQVSAAPIGSLPDQRNEGDKSNIGLNTDDASWQQVMNALQSRDDLAGTAKEVLFPSPWDNSNSFRRTRSATRNVEMADDGEETVSMGSGHARSPTFADGRSQSRGIEYERGGSNETDHDEANRSGEKKKGRKPLSKEEALERRRESNRECSRRSRQRKKLEEEEIRQEFVRIQKLRNTSQETGSGQDRGNEFAGLPAGLRKKKRGRPFGSKSYANRDESESAAQGENDDRVADLKADNRMLRAEMQRLIEENAQLRARMLRVQEEDSAVGTSSRSARLHDTGRSKHDKSQDRRRNRIEPDWYDEDSLSEEAEEFLERSRAARSLPYDPIKSFDPPITTRKNYQNFRKQSDSKGTKRKRNEDMNQDASAPSIEQLLRGFAAYQQGSTSSLPQTFPTQPIINQRRDPSGLM